MAEEITGLKGKRNVFRRYLRNLETELATLLTNFDVCSEESVIKLKGIRDCYRKKIDEVLKLDGDILSRIKEQNEVEDELAETLAKNDPYHYELSKIEHYLQKIPEMPSLKRTESSENVTVTTNNKPTIKLPKLQLEKFDGKVQNWRSFWDRFETSVDSKEFLSTVEKFNYLLGLLDENAKGCVSGLTLTSENYEQAKDILKKRYGNPQVVISAHMESLVNLPVIKSMNHVTQLRKMYDQIEISIRNLKSLNILPTSYGALLIPVLNEKIPEELRMIISRKFKDDVWDLEEMINCVKDELQARERCSAVSLKDYDPAKTRSEKNPFTTAAFVTETKGVCVYCRQAHPTARCNKVTDVKARRNILRRYARCFKCLKVGHVTKMCTSDYKCRKCDKDGHHISLCEEKSENGFHGIGKNDTNVTFNDNQNNILMQTAVGEVACVGRKNYHNVRLMFDSGSQRTYITERLQKLLNLRKIRTENLVIHTFGNTRSEAKRVDVVQMKVRPRNSETDIYIEAICIPVICSPLRNENIDFLSCREKYPHLRNLVLADKFDGMKDLEVEILVGLDFYYSMIENEVREGPRGPIAVKSVFGWILCGRYVCEETKTHTIAGHSSTHSYLVSQNVLDNVTEYRIDDESNLNNLLEQFHEVESLGINEDENNVMTEFQKELRLNGKRYECKLPIKPHHEFIPDNYSTAYKRLMILDKRLRKNTELYKEYDKIIKDYVTDGIVDVINENGEEGMLHYLPHRPVIREDRETTKVRIVFDASSKASKDEPSLNECLYSGPCLLPSIYDILLRFRIGKIGVVSDIQQAFLNIEIVEEHRDLLRFLWFREILSEHREIIILRFNRVLFGLTSSPFLLNGTIAYHAMNQIKDGKDVDLILKLLRDLYVDDSTVSVDNVDDGVKFYNAAMSCLNKAGFKLRKWETNDPELRKFMKDETDVSDDVTYVEDKLGISNKYRKVLGINWNTSTDELIFELNTFGESGLKLAATKRNILKIGASFFDPLGLICPVVLQVKLFFKEICNLKIDWDTVVNEEILIRWNNYLNDLRNVNELRIPRFIFKHVEDGLVSYELHGFADSSKDAYAAVVYLRAETSNGNYKSNLISAKSKIVPSKITSIPRLELMSCLLLSKLLYAVKEALKYKLNVRRVLCWSDSEVALYWIKGLRREWKTWVEHRVCKIRDVVEADDWRHVPGHLNPADLATRENRIEKMINDTWWSGPEFLNGNENWPQERCFASHIPNECLTEVKKTEVERKKNEVFSCTLVAATCIPEIHYSSSIANIINVQKFYSFERLCHVTAFVLRFIRNLKDSVDENKTAVEKGEITVEELRNSKVIWLKNAQRGFYEDEKLKQLKISLRLYEDEFSLLRSKTRLCDVMDLKQAVKFPVILPKDAPVTRMVITDAHKEVMHSGKESTLNRVRQKYWILKGRQIVAKIVNSCNLCKQWRFRRIKATPLSNLPSYRVCSEYAFQSTGIDYAGPLYVKSLYGDDKTFHKSYILLFTCATSRGIHLEITPDLSAETLVLAIQRFLCRKGYPERFISDNGGSFKSALLKTFMRKNYIKWQYILELAPWWGGFYERLVRVVKNAIRKVLKNARINYDELFTILVQVENMINSRPLTYLSDDNMEVITPYHLLHGRNIAVRGDHIMREYCCKNENMENRAKYVRSLIEQYWKRFFHEYTTGLRETMLYDKNERTERKLIIGDVVIIKEDNLKPMHWKRGRIIELLSGKDGVIRGVKLQSTSPTGKIVYINRSVLKIIPLEIAPATNSNNENVQVNDLYVPGESNVENGIRDQVEDLRQFSENEVEDIRTIDSSLEKKKRVLPKRSVAILGEIKRRFNSDR